MASQVATTDENMTVEEFLEQQFQTILQVSSPGKFASAAKQSVLVFLTVMLLFRILKHTQRV